MTHLEADRRDKLLDEMGRMTVRSAAWEGATYMAVEQLLDVLEVLALDQPERDEQMAQTADSIRTFLLTVDTPLHGRKIAES